MIIIPWSHYFGRQRPVETTGQGISNHGIDVAIPEYARFNIGKVSTVYVKQKPPNDMCYTKVFA